MPLVLLSGGAGLLGQRLLPALHGAGWRVRCLVHKRDVAGADELVEGGLDAPETLDEAVRGVDVVLHLAALTHSHSLRAYGIVNLEGTRLLAEASRRGGVRRFVYVSSRAIGPDGGAYSRSKLAAEEEVRRIAVEHVIVRLPELFGLGGGEGVDGMRARAAAGRPILLVGRGEQELHPVHADDVLAPLVRALDAAQAANTTYTLAGERLTARSLAERCVAAAGGGSRVIGVPESLVAGLSFASRLLPLPLYPDQLARLRSAKPPLSPEAESDLGFSPRSLDRALLAP